MRGRLLAGGALCACASMIGTTAVDAAKPDMTRITIDDSFHDEFLTDACGFDVTTHEKGHLLIRDFVDGGGVLSVNTVNISLTASANGHEYRFRDVGADVTRVTPDGTVVVSIIGKIPFGWTGVVKIDADTGEVIQDAHHGYGDPSIACAALAP